MDRKLGCKHTTWMYHKYIGTFDNYCAKKIKDEITAIILCSVFLNVLLVLNTQQVLILGDSAFFFSNENMLILD